MVSRTRYDRRPKEGLNPFLVCPVARMDSTEDPSADACLFGPFENFGELRLKLWIGQVAVGIEPKFFL
jgi:hypothetical protein